MENQMSEKSWGCAPCFSPPGWPLPLWLPHAGFLAKCFLPFISHYLATMLWAGSPLGPILQSRKLRLPEFKLFPRVTRLVSCGRGDGVVPLWGIPWPCAGGLAHGRGLGSTPGWDGGGLGGLWTQALAACLALPCPALPPWLPARAALGPPGCGSSH